MQRAGVLALVAVMLAMASLVQGPGWNLNAHLGLVRALSHGTAIVDVAAVTLGLATLLLPFTTLLFAHVPAAALAFCAFALLWLPRARFLIAILPFLAVPLALS